MKAVIYIDKWKVVIHLLETIYCVFHKNVNDNYLYALKIKNFFLNCHKSSQQLFISIYKIHFPKSCLTLELRCSKKWTITKYIHNMHLCVITIVSQATSFLIFLTSNSCYRLPLILF